ncbi:MAG: FtsX-like permease family protein [bacterium]|nr:FtsX-like permease family protein [bacterium]
MNALGLALAELRHRKLSALLFAVAVAAAVALVLLFVVFARAGEADTRRIQRDAGLNLVILPSDVALERYWTDGFAPETLPAAHLERIADQDVANRLVPILSRDVEWGTGTVRVTGIAGETFKRGGHMKPVYGRVVEPGTMVLGALVARNRGLAAGDAASLAGEPFTVAAVLTEKGSREDAEVFLDLADAQRVLGLEGRVSEIQALECHCAADEIDPQKRLSEAIEALLPGTRVVRRERLADSRRRQRRTAERYLGTATPIVLMLCALWIATLAMLNVRERRAEIGVLRALGRSRWRVAAIVLARASLLGICGAALGWAVAALVARSVVPDVFRFAAGAEAVGSDLVAFAFVLAPVFAVAASLVPAAIAATQDPAEVLRDA